MSFFNIFPRSHPIGVCHYDKIPPEIQADLANHVTDGYVNADIKVHQSATDGPYIEYSGYKIRVAIENLSPSSFRVKLL